MRGPLQRAEVLALGLLTAWFLLATVPFLADYPPLDWPQMGIAAPAWKLASEGVYGNELFAGYHRSELRNYEYMPAYPLLVAAAFRTFGLGVFEARAVSLLCGWLAVMMTFWLGRRFWGSAVGFTAAGVLLFLRLGLLPGTSGIPLLDYARIVRYDILVPGLVLAATLCFLLALESAGPRTQVALLLAAGGLAGLAGMAHVYGAFVLLLFLAVLAWRRGRRLLAEPDAYLLGLGFLVAFGPWIAYVASDVEAYSGQMSRHAARFELFDPGFYWNNLLREPGRFGPWLKGGLPATLLRPRVGIWLLLAGAPFAIWILLRRLRRNDPRPADLLLLLSVPLLELCLALLIFMKRPVYVVLLLPFLALWLGVAGVEGWRRAPRARPIWILVLLLAFVEGSWALGNHLAEAGRSSSYLGLCDRIAERIPPGSRVLLSQPFWLGLERVGGYELRSLHLWFLLARDRSLDEAFAELAPDVVVIEDYFLKPGSEDPRGPPPDSAAKGIFLEMAEILAWQCPSTVQRVADPTYGAVEIHSCSARPGSPVQ